MANMQRVDSLMKILEDPKASLDKTDADIKDHLDEIKNIAVNRQSSMDSIFMRVRDNYYGTLGDKKKIRESGTLMEVNAGLKQQRDQLQSKLDDCQKTLDQMKMMNSSKK